MASSDFGKAGHSVVNVVIVCMIPAVELRALRECLAKVGAAEIDLDVSYPGEAYFSLESESGYRMRVAVLYCDGQTNMESALTTQLALFRHNPRFVFLCGIGGGLRTERCRLGDVVVDHKVVYRRYTKIDEQGTLLPEVINVPPSRGGQALIADFISRHPHPERLQSTLNDGQLFAMHADEKLLSWDFVLDHEPTKRTLLSNLDRQLAVVEMEGAGFFKAVESHRMNLFSRPWARDYGGADAVVIRGISDRAAGKADSDASSVNHRMIAARNAAQVTLLLCRHLREQHFAARR